MSLHTTVNKGHFSILDGASWTRVYFILKRDEKVLYIYKQKKDQKQPWKKINVEGGTAANGREPGEKHVFVFQDKDGGSFTFKSMHKPKKKRWIGYLNSFPIKEEVVYHHGSRARNNKGKNSPKQESNSDKESSSESETTSSEEHSNTTKKTAKDEPRKKAKEEEARKTKGARKPK
jgi:hypothetical protein